MAVFSKSVWLFSVNLHVYSSVNQTSLHHSQSQASDSADEIFTLSWIIRLTFKEREQISNERGNSFDWSDKIYHKTRPWDEFMLLSPVGLSYF